MNFIFLTFIKVWTQWVLCKVYVTPFGCHLLCMRSIAFILWWMSEKWNLFLNCTLNLPFPFQINWYTKRGMLAGIYKSTEIYMLQDKSEDFQDTWEFLDRRVEDVSKFGKTLRSGQQSGAVLSEALYGLCIMGRNILGMKSRAKWNGYLPIISRSFAHGPC